MRLVPIRRAVLACFVLLAGCNNVGRDYADTALALVASRTDVVLGDSAIHALRFPAVYLRIGDGPQVVAILALSELGEYKWVTSDRVLLTVREGRLLKLAGAGFGPLFTSGLESDPLRDPRSIDPDTRWTRQMDWQVGDDVLSNYTVEATYVVDRSVPKVVANQARMLTRVRELNRVVQTGAEFTNEFWFDPADGVVLASRQYALPASVPVELTTLKSPLPRTDARAPVALH